MDFLVNILVLLAIIVPLVLAHEVGHFIMARRAGQSPLAVNVMSWARAWAKRAGSGVRSAKRVA